MGKQKDISELKVDFTAEKKNLSFRGHVGGVIGNIATLIHMCYRLTKSDTHKKILRDEITKIVNSGVLFMTDEEIVNATKKAKKEGGKNE